MPSFSSNINSSQTNHAVSHLAILSLQDMVSSLSPCKTPSQVWIVVVERTGMVPSPDSIFVRSCPLALRFGCLSPWSEGQKTLTISSTFSKGFTLESQYGRLIWGICFYCSYCWLASQFLLLLAIQLQPPTPLTNTAFQNAPAVQPSSHQRSSRKQAALVLCSVCYRVKMKLMGRLWKKKQAENCC